MSNQESPSQESPKDFTDNGKDSNGEKEKSSSNSQREESPKATRKRLSMDAEYAEDSELIEELTCVVCTSFLYHPVSFCPCLHKVCFSCIVSLIDTKSKSSSPKSLICCLCRTPVQSIGIDRMLQSVCLQMIKKYPSLLTSAEIEHMDQLVKAHSARIASLTFGESSDEDDYEYSDESGSDLEPSVADYLNTATRCNACQLTCTSGYTHHDEQETTKNNSSLLHLPYSLLLPGRNESNEEGIYRCHPLDEHFRCSSCYVSLLPGRKQHQCELCCRYYCSPALPCPSAPTPTSLQSFNDWGENIQTREERNGELLNNIEVVAASIFQFDRSSVALTQCKNIVVTDSMNLSLDARFWHNNPFELSVFNEILKEQKLNPKDVFYTEFHKSLQNEYTIDRPARYGPERYSSNLLPAYLANRTESEPYPPLPLIDSNAVRTPLSNTVSLSETSIVCSGCVPELYNRVLRSYHSSIPKELYPSQYRQRTDCWYGTECRTQVHNPDHARRHNHICPNTYAQRTRSDQQSP